MATTAFGMPLMGFGTYRIRGLDSMRMALDAALSSGYRLIDTAQGYENEAEIGTLLEELMPKYNLSRADVFLTTKLSKSNMAPEKVLPSLRESLLKLRSPFVDLFLIHYPKPAAEDEQSPQLAEIRRLVWAQMEESQRLGLSRHIGVSNYEASHLSEMDGTTLPAVNQTECHPHLTRLSVREACRRRGVHVQAFTSLGRNNEALVGESTLAAVAELHGASPQQILLAWALSQGISVVPKSSRPDVIRSNFEASQIKLSREDIDSLSRLNRDHPYTRNSPWNVA